MKLQATGMPIASPISPLAPQLHVLADPRVGAAVRTLSVPRAEPADSFVLHAPLELLARIGLLPFVPDDRREAALERIVELGRAFDAAGPPVAEPHLVDAPDVAAAAVELDGALRRGDLDAVDAWTVWLADRASHRELADLLGESIVDSLAAAGHAPIGLHLLMRVVPDGRWGALLRQPLRELARRPEWRISWFRDAPPSVAPLSVRGARALAEAIARVPHLGLPGSNFIFPLMSQVESSGLAVDLLAPALVEAAPDHEASGRTLLRAASWSMVHDDEAEAPYGWSHCLTMPQGVLALAGRGVAARTALAVAATYVAGFRAGDGLLQVPDLDRDPADASALTPVAELVADLATNASLHHDAHLVKYTLACLHAADDDPAWATTHLTAAMFLADWWRRHPDA